MSEDRSLSVAAVLTIPPLDQGSVIAGHRGLTREVRWVDIIHAPAEDFVRPGDLVLTTGADIEQPGVREFLVSLVASPAAGVVLSPPPDVDAHDLLELLVPLADEHSFPFVLLPWEIAFADVQKTLLPLVTPARANTTSDDYRWSDIADGLAEALHEGPLQFAEVLRQHPRSMATILQTLQPLVDYDNTRRGQLVHTLEIVLNEATNTSAAARALFLNRHSLLYRIKLIEELTGLSLKNPADRFQLEVSVRVHHLNQER